MLRRSLRRSTASVRHGAFQRSQPLLLFFRKRPKELHRVARQRPWWESAAIICGLVLFINMTSATFYAFNRWYQSWRPSGNDIFVATTIDEKLFSRPDLAVAAVRMAFFHALSNSSEPFGQPMVAPECYRSESEELLSLVQDLHSSQPMYSMADLWAIVSAKALARLGGPNLQVLRGREDIHEPNNSYLRISPPAIPENQRDVLNLKRVLSHRGFSVEQIVALIGASRNIGFHESSNFHTKQIVKPNVRNARQAGPAADEFHLPDSIEKCTLDPFVFGGEYFDYLLNYNWKKESKFFGTSQRYRCIDTDRRREVVFLDPFSEKSVEADRRRIESREKANSALETLNRGAGENAPRTGRSGEAQTIAVTEHVSSAVAKEELEVVDPSAIVNVCDSISMKDIDMMLLDDALTCGWVHRMTENEVEFYSIAGETLLQIQKFGYNENQLFLPR